VFGVWCLVFSVERLVLSAHWLWCRQWGLRFRVQCSVFSVKRLVLSVEDFLFSV
jgi:hypothetical protein